MASLPTGLTATAMTVNGSLTGSDYEVNMGAGTVTFSGTYDESGITLTVMGTLADGKIPVSFTTAAFGVNIDTPSEDITTPSENEGDGDDVTSEGGGSGGGCNTGAYGLFAILFSLASPELKKRVCRALRK